MSSIFETPSGIALPCQERDERQLEQDLKRLDPDLFLVKEVYLPTGAPSFAVYQYMGPERPPLHLLYWTEDRTRRSRPLPLSTGIFYEIESRKQNAGRNLAEEARNENARRLEADLEQADEERGEYHRFFRRRLRLGSAQNVQRFFHFGNRGERAARRSARP